MAQPIPRLSRFQGRAIGHTIDATRTFTRLVALVVVLGVAVLEGVLPGRGRSPRTDRALAKLLGVDETVKVDGVGIGNGSTVQRTTHDAGHGWRVVLEQDAASANVSLIKNGVAVWNRKVDGQKVATSTSSLHLGKADWRALDAGIASYVFPMAQAQRAAARAELVRVLATLS